MGRFIPREEAVSFLTDSLILIDANILLDVLQKREPHYRDSALIWKLCETAQTEGDISALTFANQCM